MAYTGGNTTGFMSPARDNICGVINLTDVLDLQKPERYLMQIADDGMQERGIFKGDIVVVDTRRLPRPGVLAVIAQADHMAHMVAVLVDHDVIARKSGEPYAFYDLSDSYCSNPF